EAPRIILTHLGVRIAKRRPIAETCDIHAPDVEAGIAFDHPICESKADAAALAEARHDAAGDPEILQALDRADERIAVRGESKGGVDDLTDADLAEFREMFEGRLEAGCDAVEIVGEEILAEVPRRLLLGPRDASLFVRADQHAAAFLAHIDLTLEI